MDRMRQSTITLTETLDPEDVETLLDGLFPVGETHNSEAAWRSWDGWSDDMGITVEEVREAIRGRRRGGCPAPGPDGLSLTIWKCASSTVAYHLSSLFTLCLKEGKIPDSWKRAILILLPKGKSTDGLPKVRPICLINDIGKFFEQIVDKRLKLHLNTLPRLPSQAFINGMQFGFREGFSTVDALDMVTNYIRDKISDKKMVLAVSLDIKNAFISLSWNAIRWALQHKKC